MHFRTLILAGILISSFAWGVDRKPAVEDFVGIEVEQPETTTPQGTGSLEDLGKDIQTIHAETYTVKKVPKPYTSATTPQWSIVNIMALILILGLPLLSWLMVMNRMRKRASLESASNVEVLERYRRDRELSRKKEEAERKAS